MGVAEPDVEDYSVEVVHSVEAGLAKVLQVVGGGWYFEAVCRLGTVAVSAVSAVVVVAAVAVVAAVWGFQLRKGADSEQLERKGCAMEASLLDTKSCD